MDDHSKKGNKRPFKKNYNNKYSQSLVSVHKKKRKNLSDYSASYIPEKYTDHDFIAQKMRAAKQYLESFNEAAFLLASSKRYFLVEVDETVKHSEFVAEWSDFLHELEKTPDLVIGIFGLAMCQIIEEKDIQGPTDSMVSVNGVTYKVHKKITPQFVGLQKILSFNDLKIHNYERFVCLIGMVVRTSDVKPFCIEMAFECLKCKSIQVIEQDKGCYTLPNKCVERECHSTSFQPLLKSPLTQTVPWKTMRLQELNSDLDEGGRVPKTVECELYDYLTNSSIPGDVVTVSGILTLNNVNDRKTTLGKDAGMHIMGLDVNSITFIKGNAESKDLVTDTMHFSKEDLSIVQCVHSHSNLFELIVSSLAPNIYGHELVKAGIILALFGGGSSEDTKQTFSLRENSHILIVGDPGLGKSQLLLASSSLSPRGVYVCGNSTTSSGLTVTISRGGSDQCLEAGALVLADRGHCCIDEFDKMPRQHAALLEAMEQQTVSVAKSGAVCALPGRTSILAAANPSGGHYDRARTVSENLRIGDAMLSRFDLVFVLKDNPDRGFDRKMTDHVMGMHAGSDSFTEQYIANLTLGANNTLVSQSQYQRQGHGSKSSTEELSQGNLDNNNGRSSKHVANLTLGANNTLVSDSQSQYHRHGHGSTDQLSQGNLDKNKTGKDHADPEFEAQNGSASLSNRLRRFQGHPLPHRTIRKYISYARTFSHPRLSPEAKAILADFFLESRRCWKPPPTARMLEALVRLTRSRARVELRTSCSAEDARQVVEIMRSGNSGECLVVDSKIPRLPGRKSAKKLLQALVQAAKIKGDDCFTTSEIEHIAGSDAEAAIEALNEQGYLLKKGFQLFKLQK